MIWTDMMITVGAFEAKTHLSTLLDQVAAGEEVLITKGKPAARVVSAARIDRERVNDAYEKLKLLRKRTTLGGLSWQELRDAGRAARHEL
jgi:prevent-host-death family protein